MNAREKILASVKANQPAFSVLPEINQQRSGSVLLTEQYCSVLESIGGNVSVIQSQEEIKRILAGKFPGEGRKIAVGQSWRDFALNFDLNADSHSLEDVELAIINGDFGVAENGSIWVREEQMGLRALPFICQHLAVIISEENIVANMHEAYERIGNSKYGFGSFIAGPSKTADIEQSLVLGAHGPMSMSVFIMRQEAVSLSARR